MLIANDWWYGGGLKHYGLLLPILLLVAILPNGKVTGRINEVTKGELRQRRS